MDTNDPSHTSDSTTAEDEELCVAGLGDYQSVVDIDRDVYYGLDDLPDKYPSLVTGRNVQGYIYKKRGRLVGFVSVQLVDGGQTLTTTAGRIAPDCRGVGMYGRFTRRVYQLYRHHPDLRYMAMSVDDGNMADRGARMLKTYRKVFQKSTQVVQVDVRRFTQNSSATSAVRHKVHELSQDDVHTMMSRDPDELRHLFPEGRLFLSFTWCPYRVMAENADIISEESSKNVFLASEGDATSSQNGRLFPGSLLTCGCYYTCQNGVCYTIDVFGTTGSAEELRAHFDRHLTRLAKQIGDLDTFLHIVFPEALKNVLEKMGDYYTMKVSDIPYSSDYILEMDYMRS